MRLVAIVFGLSLLGVCGQELASPGGAGYAIVLNNHAILLDNFNNFPTDALTFEAWFSTYASCRPGALMSYALDPRQDSGTSDALQDLNHFVVYHLSRILGCHDYEYGFHAGLRGALLAFAGAPSCLEDFVDRNTDLTSPAFERNGTWHHVAVTWTAANDGETRVYKDGVLVGSAVTGKTRPLQGDGVFMLGGQQDCYGGCSSFAKAFLGLMDEVRIWNVSRTNEQVEEFMTLTGEAVDGEEGLVAYWRFDDPLQASFDEERLAMDSSGNGNHLQLFRPPVLQPTTIITAGDEIEAGALVFENGFAINSRVVEMPREDLTVEFWCRLLIRPFDEDHPQNVDSLNRNIYLLSYAAPDVSEEGTSFVSDALSVSIDLREWNTSTDLNLTNFSTRGSTLVRFAGSSSWIEFDTKWLDDAWHHLAVTYDSGQGVVRLFRDGIEQIPFWKVDGDTSAAEHPANGGISGEISVAGRPAGGSLVLGKHQGCYGGCFSTPSTATIASTFYGAMANFRIWKRALSRRQIRDLMTANLEEVDSDRNLALGYDFTRSVLSGEGPLGEYLADHKGNPSLFLGSEMPHFEFSYAPLRNREGERLPPPSAGLTGYAMQLSDQHIVALTEFEDFPTDAITVEFWMWSIDKCNFGVPFSYSVKRGGEHADMFTIFNYNNWALFVDGSAGSVSPATSGFGTTDGTWHHIAVTWEKRTEQASIYDNGRLHWVGDRPSEGLMQNGTLVLGREQDCLGGCFDSNPGAFNASPGRVFLEPAQDFFGLIDNVRIWDVVRSEEEIFQSMRFDLDTEDGLGNDFLSESDRNLVAWWKFDEGSGRRVRDATGKDHTLQIRGTPLWVVSNRLGSCGDGLLSQTEECDDGNRQNGDGCSADCRLEIPFGINDASVPAPEADMDPEIEFEDLSAEGTGSPLLDDDIL